MKVLNMRIKSLIDNIMGYRGEVIMKFKPSLAFDNCQCITDRLIHDTYHIGDRIAQMIILPYPNIEFVEVDELSHTERGSNGYGSTNK